MLFTAWLLCPKSGVPQVDAALLYPTHAVISCTVFKISPYPEQAFAEEKARQAHERELEVARLRAAQEKILDRRSELDELRARR